MPIARANGVDLYYEEAGPAGAPVILLVMGLGTQLIAWPDAFVQGLADAGYRVIRYDNRDIGLSTHLDGAPAVSPLWALLASRLKLRFPLAYTLTDMAADAVALLDALGVTRAHVVGVSMGGMIAQLVAVGHPDRVLSLTSVMSSSGAPGLPGPTARLRRRLVARPLRNPTRDQAVAAATETLVSISYPDPARPLGAFREMAARAYDRSFNPMGARRQLLAIIADGSRVARLRTIRAPTLVIHGEADQLVPIANGEDVARQIPGASFVRVAAMAHDLPPSQTSAMIDLVTGHVGAVERAIAAM